MRKEAQDIGETEGGEKHLNQCGQEKPKGRLKLSLKDQVMRGTKVF